MAAWTGPVVLLSLMLVALAPVRSPAADAPAEPAVSDADAAKDAMTGRERLIAGKPAQRALDASGLLGAQSRLAFRLIQAQLPNPEPATVMVSPGSLAMVMSLIDLGADATMKAALARTLELTGAASVAGGEPPRPRGQGPAVDLAAVRSVMAELQNDRDAAQVLAIANAIYVDPAAETNETTLGAVRQGGAEVFRESLTSPDALGHINGWVRDKTHGLIPTILERLPADPGLVALNALYFKDRWRTAFVAANTRPMAFTLAGGDRVDVPMMSASFDAVPMREDDRFVAAELAYAHERFALVLVTSKGAPLPASEFAAVADWLGGAGFAAAALDVSLPRLELDYAASLLSALDAFGLKEGRASPTALDGFSPGQAISDVIQKTVLKIDEAGTEAAAATAVTTVRSAVRPQRPRAAFDKPFLFGLRDRATGLMLLAGYVGDPRNAVTGRVDSSTPPESETTRD